MLTRGWGQRSRRRAPSSSCAMYKVTQPNERPVTSGGEWVLYMPWKVHQGRLIPVSSFYRPPGTGPMPYGRVSQRPAGSRSSRQISGLCASGELGRTRSGNFSVWTLPEGLLGGLTTPLKLVYTHKQPRTEHAALRVAAPPAHSVIRGLRERWTEGCSPTAAKASRIKG